MKKVLPRQLLIALGALALGSACVEQQGSVFISGALPVEPPQCTALPAGQVYQSSGLLDIGRTGQDGFGYTIALQVTTNLPATTNTQTLQESRIGNPNYPNYGNADSNVVVFESVEVYFADENDQPVPTLPSEPGSAIAPRRSLVGGSVFNIQTTLNARASLFAPLVTAEEAVRLQAIALTTRLDNNPDGRVTLIGRIRLAGRTTGGGNVESPWFSFPLQLCKGCLVGRGTTDNGETCRDANLELQLVDPPESCFFGQDGVGTACLPP
jgi:hypothetical protein